MQRRQFLSAAAGTGAAIMLPRSWAHAQSRAESLRVLSEGAANSYDAFSVGVTRQSIQVTWNIYDRLVTFGYRDAGDGVGYYDYFDIEPQLAESFEIADDQKSITFRLREGARFHDGSPVTAEDVKWSLDRVVASPIGAAQFRTGSMTSPDQFVVVDDLTIRIDLPQPDRFALPNLALTYPIIVNSNLAKQHATAEDPFAMEWLRTNPAGGGAFRVAQAEAGERMLFERNDDWKSGKLPGFKRVLWQTVPAAETRVASLLRGDADIVQDLPPKDVQRLLDNEQIKVVGVPTSSFHFIAMNSQMAPFDNRLVRQAIAFALPYEDMFNTALFGRGKPLHGGRPGRPDSIAYPQQSGYDTDLDKARTLLAEAGYPEGFKTTFSYELSLATIAEPVALLLQEALAKIGIEVEIVKVPAGQLGTLLQEKKVPFYFESSISYLADPDYFFRVFYTGQSRWNFGSYQNDTFDALVKASRYEADKGAYQEQVKSMIEMVKEDVPIIILWNPALEVGMQKDIEGYAYAFHRQLEMKTLYRG
ncbi:ABC transporter substrate-binding protein [Pseudodonghicola xiamenensis]|uniref:ABC transporter substrate-binding protein n=1 Tax=Pseudodonghicola xiamenensis TaxID=337702 RepID=A0A8J3H9B3_9RHOB|nr:ABC transporter substrate-binding protein [Pseudodonghicola xiamenensis]GHG92007.1 ABC transporter substrate-binding protein [Pseudodonghicola xiamenensis]